MSRLRFGKFCVSGGVPSGKLAHDQPLQRDAVRQVAVPRGVDAVEAGAHHGHRREPRGVAGRIERALVRRTVDAQRES